MSTILRKSWEMIRRLDPLILEVGNEISEHPRKEDLERRAKWRYPNLFIWVFRVGILKHTSRLLVFSGKNISLTKPADIQSTDENFNCEGTIVYFIKGFMSIMTSKALRPGLYQLRMEFTSQITRSSGIAVAGENEANGRIFYTIFKDFNSQTSIPFLDEPLFKSTFRFCMNVYGTKYEAVGSRIKSERLYNGWKRSCIVVTEPEYIGNIFMLIGSISCEELVVQHVRYYICQQNRRKVNSINIIRIHVKVINELQAFFGFPAGNQSEYGIAMLSTRIDDIYPSPGNIVFYVGEVDASERHIEHELIRHEVRSFVNDLVCEYDDRWWIQSGLECVLEQLFMDKNFSSTDRMFRFSIPSMKKQLLALTAGKIKVCCINISVL
ncbi:hypothetical protein ACOME3_007722 [Neoechinorhynchus agilis]